MTGELWNDSFRLGDFLVDPRRNRITGAEGEVSLQPKAIDVLCALARRHGEVLSRAELIDIVWGREFGADESLTRAISQLRKAFGDTREEPQVIETISKRGYRLIVAPEPVVVREVGASSAPARRIPMWWIAIGAAALILFVMAATQLFRADPGNLPPARSERTGIVVTVEPFAADPGFPGSGFADELGAAIARSPLVRVRTSAASAEPGTMQYRLRGTIRHIGDSVRVAAQLTDAATGEVVWGESFDRRFDPQFSERASIIGTISSETLLPMLRSAKAKADRRAILSLAPWELTLLVTWVPGSEGKLPPGPPSEESYWLQRRALELDPDYAPAHALFAQLASYHALFDPPFDNARAGRRAQSYADRALELAPYDAEVLYQVALHYRFAGDRERAAAALDRVLELQPNHPLARIDRPFVAGQCQSDSVAAVGELARTVESLPPSSPARWVALAHLSALHLGRGEFAQARETALRSRRIVRMTWTTITLAAADAELGNRAEALAALAEERREWPNLDIGDFADRVVPRWCLGGPRTPQVQMSFRKLAAMLARQS
ncbi:winged helix-turn-helix domain-containing protein [Sphingomonas sp. BT-65]|uniref:winged helix-turn-helix domain-containing protein n=1 Tax=Sphingomonas sp. BT-65 TaxID=2989821 RepID=UPI002235D44F|nr:winged helix-turn-helix domain-containing protein [Sphingomonas sp. BT-65]MCW4460237.1 winged helix-turn-helix domain-containing protein [Sphingomonas sp. BT-65]